MSRVCQPPGSLLGCEDGPTTQYLDGTKEWYRNGQRHRENGPAFEGADGTNMWYRNGQRHRENGPAIQSADGTQIWYRNGQRHRENGAAVEHCDGTKEWYRNGLYHREDGPAVEQANGEETWYLEGKKLTESEIDERKQALQAADIGKASCVEFLLTRTVARQAKMIASARRDREKFKL